jgi:uncharacterized protein YycO
MSTAIADTGIDLSMVQPADIILTTADSATSAGIRLSTCGVYSHAILALPDGECIQAMPDAGVEQLALNIALGKSTHATLYRHKWMNEENASYVCHFAKMQKGKKYDFAAAARSGVTSGCGGIFRHTKQGFIVEVVHDITQKRKHNNKFFCSELIASAFEKADLRLLDLPSHAISPTAITTSNKITLIKELITA